MSDVLKRIINEKQKEITRRKERGLFFRPFWDHPRRSLKKALRAPGLQIIAEVKRASPSKGLIAPKWDPVTQAQRYQEGGAAAVSCLTDEPFFRGHLEYLAAIRQAISLPILRKDFILDECQLEEARAFGADAVLLIVAALKPEKLAQLLAATHNLGLEALVEVHDERELEIALACGAEIIGINNRNLRTFEVSLETTLRLVKRIPQEIPVVAESGIKDKEDLEKLAQAGVKAALIGESLMRAKDPAALLRHWRS